VGEYVKNLKMIGLLALLSCNASETPIDYIKANAIDIEGRAIQSEGFMQAIQDYDLIIVGEVHGTSEYPAFVVELARLLASSGKDVSIGLEIPENYRQDIEEAFEKRDMNLLENSGFFKRDFQDGRSSMAMAAMIANSMQPDGVRFFAFDRDERMPDIERDLEMAQNVVDHVLTVKPDVTILLTGNLHSRLEDDPEDSWTTPMGYYLSRIKGSPFKSQRILSMLGRVGEGSFWINVDGKMGVHRSPKISDNYSEANISARYFLKEPELRNGHNSTFYLRTASASLPLKDENVFRKDCKASELALDLLMGQDFWTFDQSPFGHRLYGSCEVFAAELIDAYAKLGR
jgi:hypothetical protein